MYKIIDAKKFLPIKYSDLKKAKRGFLSVFIIEHAQNIVIKENRETSPSIKKFHLLIFASSATGTVFKKAFICSADIKEAFIASKGKFTCPIK